jgi:type I restriction enzyme S subunit
MSFPRYESYKESGVEWLGDVPEHWELKRLKRNLSPSLTPYFKKP